MILMHEIDDFTMTQAMKMLPRLQDSFDVRKDLLRKITFYRDSDTYIFSSISTAHCSRLRRSQHHPTLRGNELCLSQFRGM